MKKLLLLLKEYKDGIDAALKIFSGVLLTLVFLVLPAITNTRAEYGLVRLGLLAPRACLSEMKQAIQLKKEIGDGTLPPAVFTELEHRCDLNRKDLVKVVLSVGADLVPDDTTAVSAGNGSPSSQGFVAVGRALPNAFSDVNFDAWDGESWKSAVSEDGVVAYSNGTILRARWSVNLRENTKSTVSGENPKIGLVGEGGCVKVTSPINKNGSPQELRGQYWAEVKVADCPE